MEKNDLVLPLLVFWSFFKQQTVQIDQLLLIAFGINWSHQTQSIIFLPKRFGIAVDVDGAPGSTHDFFALEILKKIHFSSQ